MVTTVHIENFVDGSSCALFFEEKEGPILPIFFRVTLLGLGQSLEEPWMIRVNGSQEFTNDEPRENKAQQSCMHAYGVYRS